MPTSFDEWIMVSSFRYFLPSGIVFMYLVFYLAKKYGVEMWVGYVSIASMIFVTSLNYYPKLSLISIPLSLGAIYLVDKFSPRES